MIGQSIFQLVVLLVFNFAGFELFNLERPPNFVEISELEDERDFRILNTVIFNTFVYAQIFNEINSRHINKVNVFKGLFSNHLFIGIIILEAGLQV